MIFKPYKFQDFAIKKTIKMDAVGWFLDMGLGKTVISLTAMQELLQRGEVRKPLIIAPKKVAENVWTDEVEKWSHLNGMRLSKVIGTVKERKAALARKADAYIIGRDNVVWLVTLYGSNWPFDMLVADELSSFKNHKSKRFIALKLIRNYVKRVVGLTGTPTSNGLLDLWSQVYLLDKGKRLGTSYTHFRDEYFEPDKRNGYTTFSWKLREGTALLGKNIYEAEIHDKLKGLCYSMKASDYIDMPSLIENDQYFNLSPKTQELYNKFEKEQVLELLVEELMSKQISPKNAAGLSNKLLQFANGYVYDEEHVPHYVHKEKLEKLEEVVEALGFNNALLFYSFTFDKHSILKRFKFAKELSTTKDIRDWNKGKIKLLVTHPLSAGHGLNLQFGGNNVIWYGSPWSLELNQQGLTRVFRNGVEGPVTNTRLIARRTWDTKVIKALSAKDTTQKALKQAVNVLLNKYR